MDPTSLSVAASSFHLNASYVSSASDHLTESARVLQSILQHRRLPARGLSEHHISLIMHQLAAMDSNNFHTQLGAGEREGRCISSLVSRRHYGLSHGIGRSGELTAQQPKAVGSSLLQQLSTALALDAVHLAGCTAMTDCLLLPVATGMSLSLALLALAGSGEGEAGMGEGERKAGGAEEEEGRAAGRPRFVLLPRIDQKSCIKCIQQANLIPVVLPNLLLPAAASSDSASGAASSPSHTATDLSLLEQTVARLGAGSIACVLSVTSCFAPRSPDDVEGIARLCSRLRLPHVINNAYGLQSPQLCAAVDRACRRGRVDAVVQSMDKNFLVPVGGAVVCSCSSSSPSQLLRRISGLYPGRASASSLTDLLIALLGLGRDGFVSLIQRRVSLHAGMKQRLRELAERHGERLMEGGADISMAVTVTAPAASLPLLGSMLFSRGVSGMRCVAPGQVAEVSGLRLAGWGGHSDGWAGGFLCMACAIGMTEEEMEAVIAKLDKCWHDWKRRQQRQHSQ